MNKKYLSGVLVVFVAIIGFNIEFNTQKNTSTISLMNIEALADSESSASHYWCCGNTNDCVVGPNYSIKGNLKTSPCN